MQGKTCVVTGANSGIGKSLAISFAKRGANVVLVCRSKERGEEALAEVEAAAKRETGIELMLCDVGSIASVRAFADAWNATGRHIDVLMNNAGVYLPRRSNSADGYESTFAINHLGPQLITTLLLDRLEGARVITTSSMGHRFSALDVATVENPASYWALRVYGTSKLCNILFTRELQKKHGKGGSDDRGIVAACFHPGPVGTGFAQDEAGFLNVGMRLVKWFLLTPDQGADTGLWLATDPEGANANGRYYVRRKPETPAKDGRSDELAASLWKRTAELAGLG